MSARMSAWSREISMKNIRLISAAVLVAVALSPTSAFANDSAKTLNVVVENTPIIKVQNGYYFETVVISTQAPKKIIATSGSKHAVTGSKTTYYKNANGKILWYVKVTGIFTYGNGSALCKSASVSAESKNTSWKITNKSSSINKNIATARATGRKYANGVRVDKVNKSVSLTCSASGKLT